MSDTRQRFLYVSIFELLLEIVIECSLVRIIHGKVEVDWNKFVDFELEILGKGEKIDFPKIFQGKAKNLFEKFLYLLGLLGITSINDLDHCYLLTGKNNEGGEYPLEWGFIRERDAKAYRDLIKVKYPAQFEWEISSPKKGPVSSEDALKYEQKQMTDIDVEFARTMGRLVNYHEDSPGQAVIDLKLLFDLEHKPKTEGGHESEIVQRIWGRLEEMRFVSQGQGRGYVIYLNPKEGSNEARICLNPECLRTKRYFILERDNLVWAALLVEKFSDYKNRIEVKPIQPDDCDNGEKFYEDMAGDDSAEEEELEIELNIEPSEETEDKSEDKE